jgi:uncharacterized membrane protein YecN with MAPEG domain
MMVEMQDRLPHLLGRVSMVVNTKYDGNGRDARFCVSTRRQIFLMANQLNSDEYERQMAQRRKNNRIALIGIGVVLLVVLAFSSVPNAWLYVLGIFVVIGVLLYARSIVEKRYKAAAAALKKEQEAEEK